MGNMDWEQLELNPRIIVALKKVNLKSATEILSLSSHDLQRLVHLSKSDVQHLHVVVAASFRKRPPITALQLHRGECPSWEPGHRLSLGCPVLDALLRGGLPLVGITELAGESGAGKTQLGLQLCLSVQYPQQYGGLQSGAVYICTEDSFPIRRLRQLISRQAEFRAELPQALIRSVGFSDHVYVEHAADLVALQACVSQRVPVLLARGLVRLVVVDSVAALFRSEFQAGEAVERARHMKAFAGTLDRLSQDYSVPVLCINQVTDVIGDADPARCNFGLVNNRVLPALGLAWASLVKVRLMLRRLPGSVGPGEGPGEHPSAPRQLEVVFAPHLPRASCLCGVWEEGVRGLPSTDPNLGPTLPGAGALVPWRGDS